MIEVQKTKFSAAMDALRSINFELDVTSKICNELEARQKRV